MVSCLMVRWWVRPDPDPKHSSVGWYLVIVFGYAHYFSTGDFLEVQLSVPISLFHHNLLICFDCVLIQTILEEN